MAKHKLTRDEERAYADLARAARRLRAVQATATKRPAKKPKTSKRPASRKGVADGV